LFTAGLLLAGITESRDRLLAAGLEAVPDRLARMTNAERFTFRFADAYRRPAGLFGITPKTAWVDVGADTLRARFGRWRVTTPLANISSVAVTGPYAFLKTAGPARLAITDRGLTFATNGERGVLISFRSPVRGLDPLGLLRHPELTVTVADVDGLAKRLRRPDRYPSQPA
jgi:hypothetical protein